jgi:hypothetical protein
MTSCGRIGKLLAAVAAAAAVVACLVSAGGAAGASPPSGLCPAIGAAGGCNVLITLNADGSTTVQTEDPLHPYDGSEDVVVGVLNNTAFPISSVHLSSATVPIFGFDGDGICHFANGPSCLLGGTGYEGPNNTFTVTNVNDGTVNFTTPLTPNGGLAYFGLEGRVSEADITLPSLTFTQQPSDVQVGQSMSPPVTLRLLNGSTPVTGQTVTLAIAPGSPSGTLSGGTAVTDANGIATFPNLAIDSSGTGFKLVATSGSLTATSNSFNVAAILVDCSAGCSASTPDPTAQNPTAVDINVPGSSGLRSLAAGGGQLEVILDPSAPNFCGGSPCIGSNITIIPPANVGGTITADFVYDKSISGQRGVALINVWKASGPGQPAVLVPDCKGKNPTLPCVNKRKRTNPGNTFIEVLFTGPDPIWGSD